MCSASGSNQFNENSLAYTAMAIGARLGGIYTLYSYIYIKSDVWGTLNWGYLEPGVG